MCRHLCYLGPPVALDELLLTPPHSLLRQCWAPRDMRGGGTVNVDGFGVAWFPPAGGNPVIHRNASPMWTDRSFASVAGATSSGAVLAAVRSASVGMPVTETACAPFTDGRWLFSHNGVVRGWPDSLAPLAGELPTTDLLTLDAATDSALLWALVRARLHAGAPVSRAVAEVTARVAAAAPGSRLNMLLTDGYEVAATTWTHSLWTRTASGSVTVSSEPCDDDARWQEVPDGHLLVATADRTDWTPIDSRPRTRTPREPTSP